MRITLREVIKMISHDDENEPFPLNTPVVFCTGPEQYIEVLSVYEDYDGNICIDMG